MRIIVKEPRPLTGTYQPSGNSNEAIALLAAGMLSQEPSTLHDVPDTTAVHEMVDFIRQLGGTCDWTGQTVQVRNSGIGTRFPRGASAQLPVAAILLLAPLLANRGYAALEWPAPLGRLHTHLAALRDLGVRVDVSGTRIELHAAPWQEADIVLTETSVTATALVCMLAATQAATTRLYNAASEPHLRSLQRVLVQMGARIDGIGSNLLTIHGVAGGLAGAEHQILPNHIEIASMAGIAALLPGHITIEPVVPEDLRIIRKVFARLGITLLSDGPRLHVPEHQQLLTSRREEDVDVEIDTAPWPGFPSDLVALTTVLATQAQGTTLIHEKLFSNRLLFVDKLKSMGAQIILADPHRAVVIGPTPLQAEYLDTPDVRTGLALLAAALCAKGDVVIDRAELIARNFADVVPKLQALGADIMVEPT
ncbi:MAG: UDP-N-acetylglucosamine 1-carboxyvinyltransferase [Anaerolineales bacterium]